jgi:autotransporter translocation and assembly factor TamB
MEALGKYRWNINLKNAGDFRIKNNIADITFRSDLVLKGRVEKPHIEGIIISSEGEIYYLGTEFEMVDGRVEFRDPYKIRPYIVIEAQQRIRRSQIQDVYVVTVVLEGYLDNMNIKLSSNPPKTREDILSLMAFGMTRDEFKQAKSRSRSSVASTILADELSGALESSLGRAANLDIFRLEATDPDQAIISKVSVGKNITDRLSVEFSNDFLPESAERTVSSKYYLTDNFFLEGATTQRTGQENRYQFNLSLRFHVR